MNKPFFVGCTVVILGAVATGLHFYNTNPTDTGQIPPTTSIDEKNIKIHSSQSLSTDKTMANHNEMPPPSEMEVLLVNSGDLKGETIWSAKNSSNNNKVPSQYSHLADDGVDRAYLHIQRLEIEALETGTNFTVDIPQTGNAFEAEVSDTHYHPNGDKSVTAVIDNGDGEPHTVTITQGEKATFGTFSTPDGVYILESDTRDGWLASKSDLINIQDRSKTDEVHIDQDNSDLPPS